MAATRTKVSSGVARAAAAGVIPDPTRKAAPPKEEHGDPWDQVEADAQAGAAAEAAGESVSIDSIPEEAPKRARIPADSSPLPRGPTPGGWGAMIHTVTSIDDPRRMYDRLYNELTLGEGATEYGAVLVAADRAEQNRVDACRLARFTKLEDERVEHEVKKRLEVLRTSAREELDKEKAAGTRSKAPTIQDVEDRVVANWPDEVESIRRRTAEMHGVLRAVEGLEDAWKSRCHTLRVIMERVAGPRR